MRLRDRVDDRKPKADAALRACAGGVRSSEAVEDPRDCVRRNLDSVVDHLDRQLSAVPARAELDRVRALGVLDGVFEEGVERVAERLWIGPENPSRQGSQSPNARLDLGPAEEDILG